ncbi:hypothetical protein OUZ56_005627 [Daphnia magna]|uniref:Uncharacterized protein n=1 Tax=Daphnia magna TaxID=35525 RepID=A0ABQ9YTA7_9CRUS|nr:hypothetical protein OUZ56_005627 [Daphnia magna]
MTAIFGLKEQAMEEFTESLDRANKKKLQENGTQQINKRRTRQTMVEHELQNPGTNSKRSLQQMEESPTLTGKTKRMEESRSTEEKMHYNREKGSLEIFITELGSRDQPKMWSFVKCMLGKGINLSPDTAEIRNNEDPIDDPKEKAELFLEIFSKSYTTRVLHKNLYEELINSGWPQTYLTH